MSNKLKTSYNGNNTDRERQRNNKNLYYKLIINKYILISNNYST